MTSPTVATRAVLLLALGMALASGGACRREEPSRWDDAQRRSENARKAGPDRNANAAAPTKGGNLNEYFPETAGGFERVASQEKEGFAEYKLKRGGKDVAMLAISDTRANPEAAQKFRQSAERIGGYPATTVGSTQTAVLVGDRFQVKVLSRDPSFTKADREAWIQKFDLKGLEALK